MKLSAGESGLFFFVVYVKATEWHDLDRCFRSLQLY
jgi:hypothetical protein